MPRELIEPHKGDKRYVRRKGGEFTTRQTDVGRLLSADRRSKAKRVEQKGGWPPNVVGTPWCSDARRYHPCGWHS
jgi:hypothetical protein